MSDRLTCIQSHLVDLYLWMKPNNFVTAENKDD